MPFDFENSEVLITGGTRGIGLGLAERLLGLGARVVVTGRNPPSLNTANDRLTVVASDIGSESDRTVLAARVSELMPNLNVVINNAGIQRRVGLASDNASWAERQQEINILLAGPIHLNHLLIPRLLSHGRPSMIANVSSGGAFVPQVFAPTYSACKAAIHSYTMVLREALANTSCQVVEIIPPAVQTHLGGTEPHGAPLDAFCDTVFSGLAAGRQRIGFGFTEADTFVAAEKPYEDLFRQSAERANVAGYR